MAPCRRPRVWLRRCYPPLDHAVSPSSPSLTGWVSAAETDSTALLARSPRSSRRRSPRRRLRVVYAPDGAEEPQPFRKLDVSPPSAVSQYNHQGYSVARPAVYHPKWQQVDSAHQSVRHVSRRPHKELHSHHCRRPLRPDLLVLLARGLCQPYRWPRPLSSPLTKRRYMFGDRRSPAA